MFSLNSATFTHFLQKQWGKDKHGKLWHVAKGYNMELIFSFSIFTSKWHLHSSLTVLHVHPFQLEVCSRAQTNKITSKRLNQVDLDVNLTPPASTTSAALGISLALCLEPFSFPSKNSTDKKHSSHVQMGKKLL